MKYKYLIFIPARSGSKGLKKKNIKKINKLTLLDLAILDAKKLKLKNSYIYVSTDVKRYLKICYKHNLTNLFLRSKKNSQSNSNIVDAIKEFLLKSNYSFENIILLQPTSPLRKIQMFKKKIFKLDRKYFNSIVSIKNLGRSNDFIFKLNKKNEISLKKPITKNPNRQNYKTFTPCGSFYSTRTKLLLKNNSLFNPPVLGIETEYPHNLDIDNKMDFKVAQLFKK